MNPRLKLPFWQTIYILTVAFVLAGTIQMVQIARSYKIQILHSNWIYLIVVVALFIAAILALIVISWIDQGATLAEWPEAVIQRASKWWKVPAGLAVIALPIIFATAIFNPYAGKYYLSGYLARLALFWCLALAGMFCVRVIRKDLSWLGTLAVSGLIMGFIYRVAVSISTVSNYPFARGWSEVSRIYGASLFFSQQLYGAKFPLSVLHPAWHLMLAAPFLFGSNQIWVYRSWQVILQVGLTGVLALGVVKRLGLRSRLQVYLMTGWAFLFLMQGIILVHLLACAIIVIFAVKPERFWRTTIIVLVASVWAGWCRINWFPVPSLIASVLYLLENPITQPKRWFAYLWKPMLWFLTGTLVAIASNVFYMSWSGNGGGGNFTSSLTSDMLWYRLLPNPTYPHGVLPDLLLVSIPLILAIIFALRQGRGAFRPVRLVGILGSLLVLCIGGLVVSAKIGGGSDLHNLDAYLILLLLVAVYLFFGTSRPEPGKLKPFLADQRRLSIFLFILGIVVPVGFALQYGRPILPWDHQQANQEVSILKSEAETISRQGGEVLFISERQFLALKTINVPLVPDYEQDYLMEMVMSHNRAYLDQFQADLKAHRFALIVADEQRIHYYGRKSSFGEENDLWVQDVSIPVLCYYSPAYILPYSGTALYVPSEQPCK
ncbi:MAG: hypothetical protein WCE68_04575 [Anaerolineales bacterium]